MTTVQDRSLKYGLRLFLFFESESVVFDNLKVFSYESQAR